MPRRSCGPPVAAGRRRWARAVGRPAAGASGGAPARTHDDPADQTGAEHPRGVTSAIDRPAALDRFLTALDARDASPNTRRAYATAVGAYLAWLDERGIDWRTPGPAPAAGLPRDR